MAKIKLKNIYICESVIVSFNGQLSLINIIPEITAVAFPAIHLKLTVLVGIAGDEGSYEEKIEIISPNDDVLAIVNGKAEIKGQGGNNFIATFINTQFKESGKYWVRITVDGNILTNKDDHSILVKKI